MKKKIILYGLGFLMLGVFYPFSANAVAVKLGRAFQDNVGINMKDMPTRKDPITKLECVRNKDCGAAATKYCLNNSCVACTYSCPASWSQYSTGKCESNPSSVAGVKASSFCTNKDITCYSAGRDCPWGQVCASNACVSCAYSCPSGYYASSTGKCGSVIVSIAGAKNYPACPAQNISCYTAGTDCASNLKCWNNACVDKCTGISCDPNTQRCDSGTGSCAVVCTPPGNGSCVNGTPRCNVDYYMSGGSCVPTCVAPKNGYCSSGIMYCNSGYTKSGAKCMMYVREYKFFSTTGTANARTIGSVSLPSGYSLLGSIASFRTIAFAGDVNSDDTLELYVHGSSVQAYASEQRANATFNYFAVLYRNVLSEDPNPIDFLVTTGGYLEGVGQTSANRYWPKGVFVYVTPPTGYGQGDLLGFIPSISMIYFDGDVVQDDSLNTSWTWEGPQIKITTYNSEQRKASKVNWLAIWKKK